MSDCNYYRVLWQEGMLIGPQHFQQSAHYHEVMLDLRARYLNPYSWGLLSIDIDAEQFKKCRIFALKSLQCVLPSGTMINIPCGDQLPPSREIAPKMFSGTTCLSVYIAIPDPPTIIPNDCGCPPSTASTLLGNRYIQASATVADENNSQSLLEILVAQKNLRLLMGNELSDGYERLKIAELIIQDGSIVLNDNYIPPSLILATSPRLLRILDAWISDLTHLVMPGDGAPLPALDSVLLWILGQASGLLYLLKHFSQAKAIHPELVYRHLAQFIGQLRIVFRQTPTSLPDISPYNHENLADTFTQLQTILGYLLEMTDKYIEGRRRNGSPAPPGNTAGATSTV
ncbi:MAG: type VI secretion system baseplate subunit TssK [Oscillochloris sp.]|nr:type VI secretion system baseplate subunit TssK [Oscillochloris sp.]